VKVLYNRFFFF